MDDLHGDTSRAAHEARINVLRRLGLERRMLLAAEMSEEVLRIACEGERRRHPELSEAHARAAVLRRMRASSR